MIWKDIPETSPSGFKIRTIAIPNKMSHSVTLCKVLKSFSSISERVDQITFAHCVQNTLPGNIVGDTCAKGRYLSSRL